MSNTDAHLSRLLTRFTEIIADEVSNCLTLAQVYPDIGDVHPALGREGHVQSVFFTGLRNSGYFAFAQCNYFTPRANGRRIDLAVWLPDSQEWVYIEIEPHGAQAGLPQQLLADAQKLINDDPSNPRDQLRCLIAYGFSYTNSTIEHLLKKYDKLDAELTRRGFRLVGIKPRSLDSPGPTDILAGMWVIGKGRTVPSVTSDTSFKTTSNS